MSVLLKTWALVRHTVRESLARKTFIAFFTISTIVLIFMILALNIEAVEAGMAMVQVMGQDINKSDGFDIQKIIMDIEAVIAVVMFSGGIFLSIFATASLVPNMLEKGYIELLVSKPLTRTQIILGRYLGAVAIMGLNVIYLIGGTWLILSIKTGVWYQPYLYSIPMIIVTFAIVHALMVLVGVTTRSTGVTIMVAYTLLFLSPFLQQKDKIYALLSSKVYYYLLESLYQILPKTFELGEMNHALVVGRPIDSWVPLWTSCVVGVVLLSSATLIFSRKDF